jgi:hypothetical protein
MDVYINVFYKLSFIKSNKHMQRTPMKMLGTIATRSKRNKNNRDRKYVQCQHQPIKTIEIGNIDTW